MENCWTKICAYLGMTRGSGVGYMLYTDESTLIVSSAESLLVARLVADCAPPIDCDCGAPFEMVVTCWLRFELLVFGSNRTFVANVRANECTLSSKPCPSILSSIAAVMLVLATVDRLSAD